MPHARIVIMRLDDSDAETDEWLRRSRVITPPAHPRLGASDHFVRLGSATNPALTAAVAALSDLVTHDVPTAELAQRYRQLNRDEMAVLAVLGQLAQGGSIYKVWIAEEELLQAMDSELSDDARRRLIANMKSRGILEEGADKWRGVW
jgi:hypothetical protein